MDRTRPTSDPRRVRRAATTVVATVTLLSFGLVSLHGAAAATTVPLGTAGDFALLAGSTITNTGETVVSGDIGLHPGTAVTGFGPGAHSVTHEGSLHVADEVARDAKDDLTTATTNAAGQGPVTRIATELGESTLTAGVYDSASGTFGVTGTLTLDGAGDPDAVFIFQMATTLTTASASRVEVINDADLCNVFWQVGSSATLGDASTFLGTVMADQSISLDTGATVHGRLLASVGAVTMDSNLITNAACVTPADDDDTDDGTDGGTDDGTDDGTDGGAGDGTDRGTGDGAEEGSGDDRSSGGGTTTDGPTSGDGSTTDAGGTPGGDTTGQVREVPSGGVAAGGGPATAPDHLTLLLVSALGLVAVAAAVGSATRLRVRASGA